MPNSKSGYAKDIKPELLTEEEKNGKTVPIATDRGGVLGSAKNKHYAKNIEIVTAEEANRRMIARMRGELPELSAPHSQYEDGRMELNDSPEAVVDTNNISLKTNNVDLQAAAPEGFSAPKEVTSQIGLAELTKALNALNLQQQENTVKSGNLGNYTMTSNTKQDVVHSYFNSRSRVSLQVENAGSYSIPAIDVIKAGFGVLVLLPAGDNDAVFIPNAGTSVDITFKNKTYSCYFPGVTGEIPDLKILVMSFIDKE